MFPSARMQIQEDAYYFFQTSFSQEETTEHLFSPMLNMFVLLKCKLESSLCAFERCPFSGKEAHPALIVCTPVHEDETKAKHRKVEMKRSRA